MNVTMRPVNPPDIWINSVGESVNLAGLDQVLRSLHAARRWLVKEQKIRAAGGQASARPTVRIAK